MTAMKKTTTKTTTSPAPATKSAKPAASRKAAGPVTAPGVLAAVPVIARVAAPAPAPAVKPVKAKPVTTTIAAQIDVGFGNLLHIRGVGPGLSWDKGVPLDCVADNQWQIVLPESARPIVFKFLVNDLTWSTGEDYTVEPGSSVTLTPAF
jgi:hypothetical protein